MTTPNERARALAGGYDMLRMVLGDATASPDLKNHAKWVQRHYPTPSEIDAEAKRQTLIDVAIRTALGPWLAPYE